MTNPLPAVTVHGVGKGTESQHRTRTRVTRDRDTAVLRIPVTNPIHVTFYTLSQSGNPKCGFNTSFDSMLRYSLVSPTIYSGTGWLPLLYSLSTIRVLGLSMGHASHTVANLDSLVPCGP